MGVGVFYGVGDAGGGIVGRVAEERDLTGLFPGWDRHIYMRDIVVHFVKNVFFRKFATCPRRGKPADEAPVIFVAETVVRVIKTTDPHKL